jgi:hypothetical protein
MEYNRIMLAICCLFWIIHLIHAAETDLSMLTADQTQIWLNAVSKINQNPRIEIIRYGEAIEISLYGDQDKISNENRHLFKQNIHKRIDCYLYKNQINSSYSSNIYDPCRGKLSSRDVPQTIAGTYVYTGNQTGYNLGLILVKITDSLYWFNNTEFYLFDKSTTIKNGTQLSLAFEFDIYYNSNSDLVFLNNKINDIIQQANIAIKPNQDNNLENFLFIENLVCQRHEQIVYDDLRLLKIVCTSKVTFKCPLEMGSTCWIEDKRLSNIQLNINSKTFSSDKTITVRIDV